MAEEVSSSSLDKVVLNREVIGGSTAQQPSSRNDDGMRECNATAAASTTSSQEQTNSQEQYDVFSTSVTQPTQQQQQQQQQEKEQLSKSQLKKRRRLAHKAEINKRRKQQEREAKVERAKAQGRDLEQERIQQEIRRQNGSSKAKRDARWVQRLQVSQSRFQVAIDCAFQNSMTTKEINSLALQLRYCYATNRRTDIPCLLKATNVTGQTLERLQKVSGFDEWKSRGFVVTDQDLTDVYADRIQANNLVYLTSDSSTVLSDLDDSKVYIIGGIVDRNRLKKAAFHRAQSLQIPTAKLPIDQYLALRHTTRVLTCNHVFDILMHYREHRDWQKALLSVLPQRKGATVVKGNVDSDVVNTVGDSVAEKGTKE
jgi:tRNA (guanine9-N1)-methyltransferase